MYQLYNTLSEKVDFQLDLISSSVGRESSIRVGQIAKYFTVIFFEKGSGVFEFNFKEYPFVQGQTIFLTPHDYLFIKSDSYRLRRLQIAETILKILSISDPYDKSVLFVHVYAVASIQITNNHFDEYVGMWGKIASAFKNNFIADRIKLLHNCQILLSQSKAIWYQQNPLGEELTLLDLDTIFELSMAINEHYAEQASVTFYAQLLHMTPVNLSNFLKRKIGKNVSEIILRKIIIESKKLLIYSDMSLKNIADQLGYQDVSYFNRVFKKQTSLSANAYRNQHGVFLFQNELKQLIDLLDLHYRTHQRADFYSETMYMTLKSLNEKCKNGLNNSVKGLINLRLILEAKRQLLMTDQSIKMIADYLGFDEANHFNRFFKTQTLFTPGAFRKHWASLMPLPKGQLLIHFGLYRWEEKTT